MLRLGVAAAILCAAVHGEVAWQTASPESTGISRSRLDTVRDGLAARGTKTFLVVRRGKIVYEWYSPDWSASKPHYTASLAKAMVGGTSLLLALNDGLLSADDPAVEVYPCLARGPAKEPDHDPSSGDTFIGHRGCRAG